MTVTFCGHSRLRLSDITTQKYKEILIELIENGADEFLLGGYGDFVCSGFYGRSFQNLGVCQT